MGRAARPPRLSLVVLTAASWTLTLYQTRSMDMPMGIAALRGEPGGRRTAWPAWRGGSRPASRCRCRSRFVAGLDGDDGGDDASRRSPDHPRRSPWLSPGAPRDIAVPTWICSAGDLVVWAGGGPARLCPGRGRQRDCGRPRCAREWAGLGALALGAGCARGRALPVHPAQAPSASGHCRSPSPSSPGAGATGGPERSAWDFGTAALASAITGRS